MEEFNGKILAKGSTVYRRLPCNLQPEDTFYFEHEYQKNLPPCEVFVLHDAYFTEDGVNYSSSLNLIKKSLVAPDWLPKFRWRYVLANYLKKRKFELTDDNYYLNVVDLWSSGYAHWILDALPRLYASRELHKNCYLLLPESHHRKYILETLQVFDFKGIKFFPANHYAKVKNLILVTHAAPQGQLNEELSRGLRQYVWDYCDKMQKNSPNLGEKIYISREKAPKRHILNETAVQALVTKYGFKIICFEDYNMFEQIAIMRQARVVVTLHGAGVSNMIFMPENAHYLEIRRKGDTNNNHFFSLASAININYWYQLAPFKASPKADGKNFDLSIGNYYDVEVDIALLQKNIAAMLEKIG
jgi:hypothetical protein